MNDIETHHYDHLRRKRYVIHEQHEQFILPETLAEMREYEVMEFYSCERIRELSQKGLIHQELKRNLSASSISKIFALSESKESLMRASESNLISKPALGRRPRLLHPAPLALLLSRFTANSVFT